MKRFPMSHDPIRRTMRRPASTSAAADARRPRWRGATSLLLPILLILLAAPSARAYDYPMLPPTGNELRSFIPAGWRLLDSARGEPLPEQPGHLRSRKDGSGCAQR